MHYKLAPALCCAASIWGAHAVAQPATAGYGPTDPAAPAPQAEYRSAFEGYQPYRDEDPADWRAANDEVARVGGHVGMMRGGGHGEHTAKPAAQTPAPAPSRQHPAPPDSHGAGGH